jgi:hypothetical protein
LSRGRFDGVLFVGADEFCRQFLTTVSASLPVFAWVKGYDLTLDRSWHGALERLDRFFNSSFLSGCEEPWTARTSYLPTAYHEPWPTPAHERLADLRNRLVDTSRFDLVFSGSDRHVRTDRYRQRLMNLLAQRGLRICIAAPADVWNRPHDEGRDIEPLRGDIRILGNWGTARTFRRARFVLDLPWLDNHFPQHPPNQSPNRTVFALGWNIFRAGAYGASVLTFDCAANRQLGLDESSCCFYRSDLTDLNALADEIVTLVRRDDDAAVKRGAIQRLFAERHTYRTRWQAMCEHMSMDIRERQH